MERAVFKVTDNKRIADGVYRLTLTGDTSAVTRAGQFVNIALDGKYLRRPISVCDYTADTLTLVYKTVGAGTKQLAEVTGGSLDLLVGLGNGYDDTQGGASPVLVGGGVGVPPLFNLAKKLLSRGATPLVCLGFNTASDVFLTEEFKALGLEVRVATMDGSYGQKGTVLGVLPENPYVFTCGPEPMLKAVYGAAADGQFSFEARMACGFGACMGCSCKTKYGTKRICKDGPVLTKEEIVW